jgi:hypothetical protein
MNTKTSATSADYRLAGLESVTVTSDVAKFVYFKNPEQFLKSGSRPYQLILSKPAISKYSDVIYTPIVQSYSQRLGCLYDENLDRISTSIKKYKLDDKVLSTDPIRFNGDPSELPVYEKPVLYLGYINPHFGHFLLESLGRWWPLTEDLNHIDNYLFHVRESADLERPFIKDCFSALGINRNNMVVFDRPVRLKSVIIAEPSLQIGSHIFSKYKELLNKLSIALGSQAKNRSDQPVFLSRSSEKGGVRTYVGEEKVEQFLVDKGVRIVYPSRLPLSKQFRVVNEHNLVIGFQGSQMFNLIGALDSRTVITLADQRVISTNLLVDKCFGHDNTYVQVSHKDNQQKIKNGILKLLGPTTRRFMNDKVQFNQRHIVDHEKAIDWLESVIA